MSVPSVADRDYGRRALPVPWFLGFVVAWLVVVKLVAVVVYVVCGIIVLVRRHHIELAPRAPEAARPALPD